MKGRVQRRRAASVEQAKSILNDIARGRVDAYEGYRALYARYCSNSAALEFIKPMFRIPNVEPDGVFSVTGGFRRQVISLAQQLASSVEE